MEDDKETNIKGNESLKQMVTSTEKQLKNVEELITEKTPLSKRDEEEIDQKAQQVAKTMGTNVLKIENRNEQQIDNLNEIGIDLNERAKQCFPDVTNPATKNNQRKNGGCCFCNQCPCCCGDGFKKPCCNIC
ncbi:uncharacterized protein LOC111121966 [Crassostrea virginica]